MASTINAKNTSTGLVISPDSSGQLELQTVDTTRMTIDSSGNVGIGTASPASALDVQATSGVSMFRLTATTGTNAVYSRYSNTGGFLYLGRDNSAGTDFGSAYSAGIWSTGAYPMLFGTNGTERMRIDSSGNLLVGRTSTVSSPGSGGKLFVDGGTIINTNGTDTSAYGLDRIAFNTSNYYVLNNSSTGVRLGSGSTSWAAQSDERLKDIIEPIENATDKVSSLRAVIGKYKSDEDGVRRSFLIAQDLQKVLPEAVDSSTLPDGEDETEYLYIKYTEVVPLLVASIQELKAELDTVKAELATLKGTA